MPCGAAMRFMAHQSLKLGEKLVETVCDRSEPGSMTTTGTRRVGRGPAAHHKVKAPHGIVTAIVAGISWADTCPEVQPMAETESRTGSARGPHVRENATPRGAAR